MQRVCKLLSVLIIFLGLAGCMSANNPLSETGGADPSGPEIIVGSANFTESELLAEMYAGALRAEGFNASTKTRIGSREVYLQALKDGSVSLIPEYTGNLLQFLAPENTARTPEEIDKALSDVAGPDLVTWESSQAANQDVYVVTKSFSEEKGIVSLRDLQKVSKTSILGGPSELEQRPYGPDGLASVYNAPLKEFKAYNSQAVKVKDLQDGKIQVATFYTTDAALAGDEFVQLVDPEMMVLPQNVVPLAAKSLQSHPKAEEAIAKVQRALSTSALLDLNRKVDSDHQTPSQAAEEWLTENDLR